MTWVFGLTGGVGSGKSTVAEHFASRGLPVIDADQLARKAVTPGSAALREIAIEFGAQFIDAQGQLDRKRLAEQVFGDTLALERLNRIVHPRVAELFAAEVAALNAQGAQLACYDVPLLFERKLDDRLRPIVVVTVPHELQLTRLMARDNLTRAQAAVRIESQLPLPEKIARADYVIDNGGSPEETLRQADAVLTAIRLQVSANAQAQ